MELSIIYFAAVRDLVGLESETIRWEPSNKASVEALVIELLARHPALRMDGVRVAVNEEFAEDEQVLASGDVVALIPPVAGG